MMPNGNYKTLAVIDLDGTLVRGNTLHIYMQAGARSLWRTRRYGKLAALLGISALRALRLVSHRRMKWTAIRLIGHADSPLKDDFTARVKASVNPAVTALVATFRSRGEQVLLASAAPAFYIPWLWDGPYIATQIEDNPQRVELRGNCKKNAVLEYARVHGVALRDVVTDHHDDLPLLLAAAGDRYLISPSAATLTTVRAAIPSVIVVN